MIRMRLPVLLNCFFAVSVLLLGGVAASASDRPADAPVGAELALCEGCPVFVRVPDAPDSLRPVRFVSKYELTWNNYLAAFDAGRCQLPDPTYRRDPADDPANRPGISPPNGPPVAYTAIPPGWREPPNDIPRRVDLLRIDWPIAMLGRSEIQCYIAWVQERTGYLVALPTGAEWEWFARAGRVGAMFPWGDDPDPTREALRGATIDRRDEFPVADGESVRKHIRGVRVGMFPPNDWRLYDIMGNVPEMTSEVQSVEERSPGNPLIGQDAEFFLFKGAYRYQADWREGGISRNYYSLRIRNRFLFGVGFRLILIERGT